VGGSGLAGWGLEQLVLVLARQGPVLTAAGLLALTIALASALAGRSLEQAVQQVLRVLPPAEPPTSPPHALQDPESLIAARQSLAWIVGRDTADLEAGEILRAAAETASENAVDGLFAPLFWMLVGAGLWSLNPDLPGPLALAWGFKAASTLDSMLGYRQGRLRWLGTAGARLDDLLVALDHQHPRVVVQPRDIAWRKLGDDPLQSHAEGIGHIVSARLLQLDLVGDVGSALVDDDVGVVRRG
jgi:adenosylcobinamide-phosphate synthase